MKEGHEESSPTPHRRKVSVTAYEELYGKWLPSRVETVQEGVLSEEPVERTVHETYPAVCVSCGQDTKVPFTPSSDRPIYCPPCFSQVRAAYPGSRAFRRAVLLRQKVIRGRNGIRAVLEAIQCEGCGEPDILPQQIVWEAKCACGARIKQRFVPYEPPQDRQCRDCGRTVQAWWHPLQSRPVGCEGCFPMLTVRIPQDGQLSMENAVRALPRRRTQ